MIFWDLLGECTCLNKNSFFFFNGSRTRHSDETSVFVSSNFYVGNSSKLTDGVVDTSSVI